MIQNSRLPCQLDFSFLYINWVGTKKSIGLLKFFLLLLMIEILLMIIDILKWIFLLFANIHFVFAFPYKFLFAWVDFCVSFLSWRLITIGRRPLSLSCDPLCDSILPKNGFVLALVMVGIKLMSLHSPQFFSGKKNWSKFKRTLSCNIVLESEIWVPWRYHRSFFNF